MSPSILEGSAATANSYMFQVVVPANTWSNKTAWPNAV